MANKAPSSKNPRSDGISRLVTLPPYLFTGVTYVTYLGDPVLSLRGTHGAASNQALREASEPRFSPR